MLTVIGCKDYYYHLGTFAGTRNDFAKIPQKILH